jgi:hypothetical protein
MEGACSVEVWVHLFPWGIVPVPAVNPVEGEYDHEEGRRLQCAGVGILLRTGGSQLYAGLRVGRGARPHYRELKASKFANGLNLLLCTQSL